jgi:hypothetical protein
MSLEVGHRRARLHYERMDRTAFSGEQRFLFCFVIPVNIDLC